MNHRPWQVLLVAALMPIAAACATVGGSESAFDDPATLTEVDGSDLMQVTFTDRAVERIGIETAPVIQGPGGLVIPYSALLYDPDGSTWAFTEVKAGTFVRGPITVSNIRAGEALLSSGPAPGTQVVTVGVAELFGAEHELGAH